VFCEKHSKVTFVSLDLECGCLGCYIESREMDAKQEAYEDSAKECYCGGSGKDVGPTFTTSGIQDIEKPCDGFCSRVRAKAKELK